MSSTAAAVAAGVAGTVVRTETVRVDLTTKRPEEIEKTERATADQERKLKPD